MILLVRHAEAEGKHGLGDWARALTREGRSSFRRHARLLAERVPLQGVATSPYVRAVQTAEILAAACKIDDVLVRSELEPTGGAARKIVDLARELDTDWALVGHNPSLEDAAAAMLGLTELPFRFKKGGALALRRRGDSFAFEWFAAPGKRIVASISST